MGEMQPKRVLRSAKTVEMTAKETKETKDTVKDTVKEVKETTKEMKETAKETKSEVEKPAEPAKAEEDSSLFDDDEETVPELKKTRRRDEEDMITKALRGDRRRKHPNNSLCPVFSQTEENDITWKLPYCPEEYPSPGSPWQQDMDFHPYRGDSSEEWYDKPSGYASDPSSFYP